MGMRFLQAIDMPNKTKLVVGEIKHVILRDIDLNDGDINLEQTNSVGISGLNSYYELKKIAQYPFVRINEVPKF